jgi:ADP-heptose:LPS heptosyltransferase
MSHKTLIFTDRLLKPFYATLKWTKAILPTKTKETKAFYVIKFFGLGSLTRIAYVIENSELDKSKVTFITLKSNEKVIAFLGLNAIFIRLNNPFYFVWDSFKAIFHVWGKKGVKVLDMERSSNFSGIFRVLLAIRKSSIGFYFKEENQKLGNQNFISLANKSAIEGIVEMFAVTMTEQVQNGRVAEKQNQFVINVNAGTYLPERMFPLNKFAELVVKLHQNYPDSNFLLTGSNPEIDRVNTFYKRLIAGGVKPERIENLAGTQNLEELTTTIQTAGLLITNDSGPIHLANYLGSKAVAIWGPTSAELVGYPDSDRLLNLTSTKDCSPCFLNPKSKVAKACSGEITCFHQRDIEVMAGKISEFIASSPKKANIDALNGR